MFKSIFSNLIILLFVFGLNNLLSQQTGKIVGKITEAETGEAVIGANVFLVDKLLGASTDSDGEFFIINVPPGTYTLETQMIGYGTVRSEGIRVSVNRTAFIEIELRPQVIEGEVIVVTAEKTAIKKDQTSSIRNISSEQIEAHPVESIEQIVRLQPGVVGSHFRGGRSSESSYMIDGVKVTESFNHTSSMVEVNPQVVEDMEVITGTFNAEYGNAMSGVVNIVTKEGGSEFQASGSVNMGNYLTSNTNKFPGIESLDLRIQDYTFSLTGPIIGSDLNFIIDGRYLTNKGHLRGIDRFNVDDYSDFRSYPHNYISEANGSGDFVDMDDNEKLSLIGKLIYRPTEYLKTSLTYTFNKEDYQNYSHYYSYNPNGMPTSHNTSNMAAFHINHTLSNNAFYEFIASYTEYNSGNYLFKDPEDSRYVHDIYGFGSGPGFSTGGQSKNHTDRKENKFGVKLDLTWQINKNHSLKSGFDLSKIKLDQRYSNIRNTYEGTDLETEMVRDAITGKISYPYYEPEIRSSSTIYTDHYFKEPIQFATYVQDKMEFEDMVINFGLRFDYFDPQTVYPTNWRNPANQDLFQEESRMSKYPQVDPFYWLSPRFGLSYKVGEAALLRFSYGHFLQVPPLSYYYQNSNFIVSELAQVGNPELRAQKTMSYEVGLWLQLTKQMDFEVAVFYRDIYDLLSSKIIYTYSQVRYGLFDNKDYGNVRGLELQYNFYAGEFSVKTNYTLQYTRGVADSPEFAFNRAGDDKDPVNKLIPLSWDQRHTFNMLAAYNTSNYGLSLLGTYNSGTPYNWIPITESPLALINLLPNNQIRPSRFSLDFQAHYNLFSYRGVDVRLTLLAYNILDRLNENSVNQTTGRAYSGIVRPIPQQTYRSNFSEYTDLFKNPGMFAAPRSLKLGLGFKF